MRIFHLSFALFTILISCNKTEQAPPPKLSPASYADLNAFFEEWRSFEKAPMTADGAPDYGASTFEKRLPQFKELQRRLLSMDTSGWALNERVDYHIVWAEMNGYDFNFRVLQPWVRDPAFYLSVYMEQSDVPAHEGPTHHATTEVWMYEFPLADDQRLRFIKDLKIIVPLNEQAKVNLTGNAKDLWIAGIRTIKFQVDDLNALLDLPGVRNDVELVKTINQAIESTEDLVSWLEEKSKTKNGPSGIGKDNYTWYQQNVHLVPLTWEDEVMLLKRELARAWSALKLEEHRNRHLPPLESVETPEAYETLAQQSIKKYLAFLDEQEIVTVKGYFEPALQAHKGRYVPKEVRNFFLITMHYDQRPLYSHFYHWFELAQMKYEPHTSAIRKDALLYNIFDSRNEGTATAVEEMFLDAGMYDESPRVREMVYILIAQRAARGLGSLYAHANEMTMEEAGGIHSEYTPRGWMKTEKELLLFEQHLYLRQPGYGTSYITGKHLLENTMAEFARLKEARGEPFALKDFFDQLNAIGCIPISLVQWEMTGKK
jgi:hypothetical protein